MAIGNAAQRGDFVYVYDEKNYQTFSIPAGSGPNDGLTGYTQSRANIRRGDYIYSYDEKGHSAGSTPVR